MRFKIDENLPVEVAEMLRAAGHDALTVLDQLLGGRPDRAIGDDVVRAEKGRSSRSILTSPTFVRSRPRNTRD